MGDKYRELNGGEFWKSKKVYYGEDYVFGVVTLRLSHLRLSHLYLIKKYTKKKYNSCRASCLFGLSHLRLSHLRLSHLFYLKKETLVGGKFWIMRKYSRDASFI